MRRSNICVTRAKADAKIGSHAGLIDTSELLSVHPQGVDLARLAALPLRSEPAGHSGDPMRASVDYGKALLNIRINAAPPADQGGAAGPADFKLGACVMAQLIHDQPMN